MTASPEAEYRVVQWGTGNTGAESLRQLIAHPRMKLVGVKVHHSHKDGRDAGDLCGLPAVGLTATTDVDKLLEKKPDCVVFMATEIGREPREVIDDLCLILESGANVVNTTIPALIHPSSVEAAIAERLQNAALAGGSTFYGTGIEPGFTADELVLTLTSMSRDIQAIEVHERINVGAYFNPVTAAVYGFGKTLEDDRATYQPGLMASIWRSVIGVVAEGLGVDIDEVREFREVASAPETFYLANGAIADGTVAGVHIRIEGVVRGAPRIGIEHDYVLRDDIGTAWRQPPAGKEHCRNTHIEVSGQPGIAVDLSLAGESGPAGQGTIATAARAVNAIPQVCAAAPGIRTCLDLGRVIGRHSLRCN